MVLVDGQLVYAWSNTERKHTVHSIRKALINSLYGIYVGNGTIDTTQTLAQLGIDDKLGLSAQEKEASLADLLKSRMRGRGKRPLVINSSVPQVVSRNITTGSDRKPRHVFCRSTVS